MNYLIFLVLLNLILISRLRLLLKDDGATRRDVLLMGIYPCLALLFFQINGSWAVLLIYLLAYPWITRWCETTNQALSRNRVLLMLFHVVVVGLLSSPLLSLQWNSIPGYLNRFIHQTFLLSRQTDILDWMNIHFYLFGLLLVINEMNMVLRYTLDVLRLKPLGRDEKATDEKEYNTGRVIGILERIFVFVFVLMNQYTAIGFILAAKGVARFRDFKSRTFAEYVLIGTLLSTLLAMLVGFFVMSIY